MEKWETIPIHFSLFRCCSFSILKDTRLTHPKSGRVAVLSCFHTLSRRVCSRKHKKWPDFPRNRQREIEVFPSNLFFLLVGAFSSGVWLSFFARRAGFHALVGENCACVNFLVSGCENSSKCVQSKNKVRICYKFRILSHTPKICKFVVSRRILDTN